MLETELFEPVSEYLRLQGYEVNAEVKNCDIVASCGDCLIIVELKTSANMQLLIQATDRQRITDSVYVAIPDPGNSRRFTGIKHVLKQLELGLLIVTSSNLGQRVSKVFDPLPRQKRKLSKRKRAVIKEIKDRSGNYNIGGSSKTKLMTAYREQAIFIATCLETNGASSPKSLKQIGAGDKTQSILAANHYGWFQRIDRGIYELTNMGRQALNQYPEIYRQSKDLISSKGWVAKK
ncbi:MAG: DUF2161 family putative PD-(D/E)XK-type phosphodiesterase [Pseudomonadales bacterium]|nr:DUF2161 family putative PD-(D/E)XK-type phosphodiesterase [Pseudomonadales bacterium]